MIPIAWFLFGASIAPAAIISGLHAVALGAFPPPMLQGKRQRFVTGQAAVARGWGTVVVGLAAGAFWGVFAYATWTADWTMLQPLITVLTVVVTAVMVVSIVYSLFRAVMRLP